VADPFEARPARALPAGPALFPGRLNSRGRDRRTAHPALVEAARALPRGTWEAARSSPRYAGPAPRADSEPATAPVGRVTEADAATVSRAHRPARPGRPPGERIATLAAPPTSRGPRGARRWPSSPARPARPCRRRGRAARGRGLPALLRGEARAHPAEAGHGLLGLHLPLELPARPSSPARSPRRSSWATPSSPSPRPRRRSSRTAPCNGSTSGRASDRAAHLPGAPGDRGALSGDPASPGVASRLLRPRARHPPRPGRAGPRAAPSSP
jgi:hypothetical protein